MFGRVEREQGVDVALRDFLAPRVAHGFADGAGVGLVLAVVDIFLAQVIDQVPVPFSQLDTFRGSNRVADRFAPVIQIYQIPVVVGLN